MSAVVISPNIEYTAPRRRTYVKVSRKSVEQSRSLTSVAARPWISSGASDWTRLDVGAERPAQRIVARAMAQLLTLARSEGAAMDLRAVRMAAHFIGQLAFDNSATPQVAADADGGVEVMWLVNGHALVASAGRDGVGEIVALSPEGVEVFCDEVGDTALAAFDFTRALQYLAQMSAGVRNPL